MKFNVEELTEGYAKNESLNELTCRKHFKKGAETILENLPNEIFSKEEMILCWLEAQTTYKKKDGKTISGFENVESYLESISVEI